MSDPTFDPVLIALDQVIIGSNMQFRGIDLESGAQVNVEVKYPGRSSALGSISRRFAYGLILSLRVEPIDASN